jgi:hypothetical protein
MTHFRKRHQERKKKRKLKLKKVRRKEEILFFCKRTGETKMIKTKEQKKE